MICCITLSMLSMLSMLVCLACLACSAYMLFVIPTCLTLLARPPARRTPTNRMTDRRTERPTHRLTNQPSKCAPVEELRCVGADPTHNARHGESTDGGAHGLHASFLSLQHIFAISLVSSRADDLAFGLFSSVMMTCLIVQGLSTVQPSHSQKAIV